MYTLDKVLKDSVAAHASDIHFTVGCSPFFRIDGMLIPQEGEKLMPKDMEELLLPILDQRHREELEENGQTDLAYAIRGVGRFRVSILNSAEHWHLLCDVCRLLYRKQKASVFRRRYRH